VGFEHRNCIEQGLPGQVVELACGQEAKIIGLANLDFEIHGRKFRQRIVVSKDEGNPLIFGLPVLSNLNIHINFEKKCYSFRDDPELEFEWRDIFEQDDHELWAMACRGCPNAKLWNELTRPISENDSFKHRPKVNIPQSHVRE